MTIGNISTLTGVVDNLDQTKGLLTCMQRGLFNFWDGDPKPRQNLPKLPLFARPEGDNAEEMAKLGADDMKGVLFFYEKGVDAVLLRFSGSFVWVLTPDGDKFSATLPYLAIQELFITMDQRLKLSLKRGERIETIDIGCEIEGKKNTCRFRKNEATEKDGTSIEHLVEKLQISCATMGNMLPIKYGEGYLETYKLKNIVSVQEANEPGAKKNKMAAIGDYLVEQREKINALTDADGGPQFTKIRQIIADTRLEVQQVLMDANDQVHDELHMHMDLLDMEYDLQSEALGLSQEDITLCNEFIREYGSDEDRATHCARE